MIKNKRYKSIITSTLIKAILIVHAFIALFPLVWNLYSSFKTSKEILTSPFSLPAKLNVSNYVNAFIDANMSRYFMNSILITLCSLAILLIFAVPSAYVLARFQFRMSKTIRNIYIAGLFLQPVIYLVPLFMLMNRLHLFDNRLGLCLVYAVTQFPFAIFLLIGFMKGIPKDYEHAAMIDGCSYFGILLKIITPMIKPAIITIIIFNFLGFWNEYPLAFTLLSSDHKKTLSIGIANLMEIQRYATDWGALFAGLAIVMIPTLIVYIFTQKKLTEGVSIGGLKG